ncbi:hypothetical protein G3I59_31180 [Amycolatopsis rubida]|uniref:Uncharacterized protein n=1 Tax=Amycolatopsis rubida TaxID=112413 RepID=A0ABX0BZL3_9PSEU|nr:MULTISPECIES: hypothetical protein [Amycolatopsis]MYW94943.1 hypothetical protein [Amycolatopsis rubida]NEC59930.1 hypothetical protein [Amycolatopsis rubida]
MARGTKRQKFAITTEKLFNVTIVAEFNSHHSQDLPEVIGVINDLWDYAGEVHASAELQDTAYEMLMSMRRESRPGSLPEVKFIELESGSLEVDARSLYDRLWLMAAGGIAPEDEAPFRLLGGFVNDAYNNWVPSEPYVPLPSIED